jgi:hypothetical protein
MRALMPGAMIGLHPRLAGLEVLAADGHAAVVGELHERRHVDREVGRAVGVGAALHDAA